jgi:iron complex outermembrane receptor protein
MKNIIMLAIVLLAGSVIQAQYVFKAIIKNENEVLPGATVMVKSIGKTAIADSTGHIIINNIPAGKQALQFSYAGYKEHEEFFLFPLPSDTTIVILLNEKEKEEEVVITATRVSRSIKNLPTRVETISGEELQEKANMKPGDIRMLLSESTGIQTQQTSATSSSSSIRIQGLDGRYTQILRDGYPLYSGFSGALSIMQITPLDLKQVEVIKGSSSTLYGGGAIAGLINLVSKTPTANRELSFLGNATSARGLDLSGFYSQRFNQIGITMYGSRNSSSAYDPAGIGLTAIPKVERYTINPRVFWYGKKSNADLGFSFISENRIGGSMDYIKNAGPGYFEQNKTKRVTAQLGFSYRFNERSALNFKNSYTRFNRLLEIPSYSFEGLQQSVFSELSYQLSGKKWQWIGGLNLLTDDFAEEKRSAGKLRNYHNNTYGVFLQNTWSPFPIFTLETGLRGDYVNEYGFELLPRISALLKITPRLTVRVGEGFGYKTPTVFNEEAEKIQFQHILPIDSKITRNEKSNGGNIDINYRISSGRLSIAINQLFFYTKLSRSLILTATDSAQWAFVNANGHIDTKGMETNLRIMYGNFKLFLGYTYADVNTHFDEIKSWSVLSTRHRLNNVLIYEKEGDLKLGLEAYYCSRQKLGDGTLGRAYWTAGFMAEKFWKRFSIFINLENFTDTRQTKFGSIYTGNIVNPVFRDIYAPLDGFVANGGFKIRL